MACFFIDRDRGGAGKGGGAAGSSALGGVAAIHLPNNKGKGPGTSQEESNNKGKGGSFSSPSSGSSSGGSLMNIETPTFGRGGKGSTDGKAGPYNHRARDITGSFGVGGGKDGALLGIPGGRRTFPGVGETEFASPPYDTRLNPKALL